MSTQLTRQQQEQFQLLLMKALDEELSADEQVEFARFIDEIPVCREEWQQHKNLKEVTKTMKLKTPTLEVWDNYWLKVYNRLERGIAWLLFTIGSVILLTYGGFKAVEAIIADPGLAGIVKAGIILVLGGLVILLVSVLREKFFVRKTDPYKEVQR